MNYPHGKLQRPAPPARPVLAVLATAASFLAVRTRRRSKVPGLAAVLLWAVVGVVEYLRRRRPRIRADTANNTTRQMGCVSSQQQGDTVSRLNALLGYAVPYTITQHKGPTFTDTGSRGILEAMTQVFKRRHDRPIIKPLDLCGFIVGRGVASAVDHELIKCMEKRKVTHHHRGPLPLPSLALSLAPLTAPWQVPLDQQALLVASLETLHLRALPKLGMGTW